MAKGKRLTTDQAINAQADRLTEQWREIRAHEAKIAALEEAICPQVASRLAKLEKTIQLHASNGKELERRTDWEFNQLKKLRERLFVIEQASNAVFDKGFSGQLKPNTALESAVVVALINAVFDMELALSGAGIEFGAGAPANAWRRLMNAAHLARG